MRLATPAAFTVALLVCGCHHRSKVPYFESAPRWRWADVGTPCYSGAPAYSLPDSMRDTSSHPFRSGGRDDWEEKAKIAGMIPGGFGGVSWRPQDPRTVIYLTDTTKFSAAVPALVAVGLLPGGPRVGVVQGRWTYEQLYDWLRYIETHIRGVAVWMWVLDEKRNRLLLGVENEAAVTNLTRKLADMHAPCFLLAVAITGPIHGAGAPVLTGTPAK